MYDRRAAQERVHLVTRPASSFPSSPTWVFYGQPAVLFICCLEEPRRNLVHTTAFLAAILFLSIPSSLHAGVIHSPFTMVLPLAQARKDGGGDTACLWVNFSLNRDRL